MPVRNLGGGDWLYDTATGAGQNGVDGGFGLNNIGLLVTVTGKVVTAASDAFYVEDGSTALAGSAPVRLYAKVICPPGTTVPAAGSMVNVTGISSCEKQNGTLHRVLKLRSENDIRPAN
jgi:hypothetical protein